jgi:CO/xanthine dehydrogenase Mo-binding subunit
LVGLGVACFVEKSGLGPFDEVRIEVDTEGLVEVITGAASVGQGIETSIAQVCADGLGVDIDRIRVTHGQTDRIERGMGAFATRVTVMTGSATSMAAEEVRQQALDQAARMLEANPTDLRMEGGVIHVDGSPEGPSLTLGEVAAAAAEAGAGLRATAEFNTDHMTYPYGVQAAVVEIDPVTGGCRVLDYLVGYDVGRSVNPMLIEGQLTGGVAQGIGGALLEVFRYDESGQPLATSFMDYLIPTAAEVPHVDMLVTEDSPSPLNPLGVKGAGEGGMNAVGAAIAAAIGDALGRPDAITELPITPGVIRQVLSDRVPVA